MTRENLISLLEKNKENLVGMIGILEKTSFPNIPRWSVLKKEYEPKYHKILTDKVAYPPNLNDAGGDDFKRTPLGLQKLLTNRVAQSMFANPVLRKYNYDTENENEKKAVDIMEEVYRVMNNIDSSNINRAKQLNCACQIAVIWKMYQKDIFIKGETSKYNLTHNIYSEKEGYEIYPITDENNDLLVLSIKYTEDDDDSTSHFMSYINGGSEKSRYLHFENDGDGWFVSVDKNDLEFFPALYTYYDEPVWGGQDGTKIVEDMEEMEGYQGLYIKRNSLPTFTLDYGEIGGYTKSSTSETIEDSDAARRIIQVGKGGNMSDVTWKGAGEAVNSRYERMRNAFFEQNQVPDTSFSNMIKSNTSSENKELIFSDARAKAIDLAGVWVKLFYQELEIVKQFLMLMFPKYKDFYRYLTVSSEIRPYSVKTKQDTADFVATAGAAMSTRTKVRELNVADDVEAEVSRIQEEQGIQANQGIL